MFLIYFLLIFHFRYYYGTLCFFFFLVNLLCYNIFSFIIYTRNKQVFLLFIFFVALCCVFHLTHFLSTHIICNTCVFTCLVASYSLRPLSVLYPFQHNYNPTALLLSLHQLTITLFLGFVFLSSFALSSSSS